MGRADKVDQIITALQLRVPEWQQDLEQAMNPLNHDDLRKICHRVRGAAGTITAERAAHYATALGDTIKAGDFTPIEDLANQLDTSLKEISDFKAPG